MTTLKKGPVPWNTSPAMFDYRTQEVTEHTRNYTSLMLAEEIMALTKSLLAVHVAKNRCSEDGREVTNTRSINCFINASHSLLTVFFIQERSMNELFFIPEGEFSLSLIKWPLTCSKHAHVNRTVFACQLQNCSRLPELLSYTCKQLYRCEIHNLSAQQLLAKTTGSATLVIYWTICILHVGEATQSAWGRDIYVSAGPD